MENYEIQRKNVERNLLRTGLYFGLLGAFGFGISYYCANAEKSELQTKNDQVERRLKESDNEVQRLRGIEGKLRTDNSLFNLVDKDLSAESSDVASELPTYSFDEFKSILSPRLKGYDSSKIKELYESLNPRQVSVLCYTNKNPVKSLYRGSSLKDREEVMKRIEDLSKEDLEKLIQVYPFMDKDNLTLADVLTLSYENWKVRFGF